MTSRRRPGRRRVVAPGRSRARTALVAYAVLVAVVLLEPTGRLPATVVQGCESVLDALGTPAVLLAPGRVEFVLNAAMVAPLTALASWCWPRWSVPGWVTLAFCGSTTVELLQALVVVQRSASFADIVANTAGGLLGALVTWLVRARWGRSGSVLRPAR